MRSLALLVKSERFCQTGLEAAITVLMPKAIFKIGKGGKSVAAKMAAAATVDSCPETSRARISVNRDRDHNSKHSKTCKASQRDERRRDQALPKNCDRASKEKISASGKAKPVSLTVSNAVSCHQRELQTNSLFKASLGLLSMQSYGALHQTGTIQRKRSKVPVRAAKQPLQHFYSNGCRPVS